MTAIAPQKNIIQVEETQEGAATAESMFMRLGGTNNFISERQLDQMDFKVNGPYNLFVPNFQVDGLITFPFPWELVFVAIESGFLNGSSGLTEVDVKWKPQGSGSYVSIFSTTPKFDSSAGAGELCANGQSATGFTAPVLAKTQFDPWDILRCDLLQALVGDVDYFGLKLFWRPR